jgi:UTP--glucose-1-phosphate uridylyltransferase
MVGSHPFHGVRIAGHRFDCGDKVGYLEANIAYALERPDLREQVRAVLAPYFTRG